MAYTVVACIVAANIVMAYMVTAYIVMANIVMACLDPLVIHVQHSRQRLKEIAPENTAKNKHENTAKNKHENTAKNKQMRKGGMVRCRVRPQTAITVVLPSCVLNDWCWND